MFVMKNHGFKRKYVYGGAGIFDSLAKLFAKLFTSGVAKQLASTAIDVGKEVGKNTAIDVGTRLVKKALTPKAPDAVATKVQNILNKYVAPNLPVRQNINSLIDGSGNNAIAIQDLVRKLHGSGLKIVLK